MRTLAEEIVAEDPTKLPEGETEVTQENYFRIASLDRLGVEQPYQFQEEGQTGYVWGSYYSDVDGTKTLGDTVNNNPYAEMPREYAAGVQYRFNHYYNWYSATAESGAYVTSAKEAQDSLCPSGWELPVSSVWQNLFINSYSITDGDATSTKVARSLPFAILYTGRFDTTVNEFGGSVRFWNRYANDAKNGQDTGFWGNRIASYDGGSKVTGNPVRCVKE